MADERESPPLFGDDETVENDPDSDDLFKSVSEVRNLKYYTLKHTIYKEIYCKNQQQIDAENQFSLPPFQCVVI